LNDVNHPKTRSAIRMNSGGQRQRILIARPVEVPAAFVWTEEQTSALDICSGANGRSVARAAARSDLTYMFISTICASWRLPAI
jgi:ABC-type oligopeptide transport system ATPase subunit